MGKVRVKTLGIEELEEKQKAKEKKRKEGKEQKKLAKGAHGGERVISMAPTEEELAKGEEIKEPKVEEKKVLKARPPRERSRRYKEKLTLVDRKKTYPLVSALELLKSTSWQNKFDGTVELHINTLEKGLSGQVTFPHGTGKKVRVAIADDTIIEEIEKGKINFDVLVSHPSMMGKLARVAKVLGPRGLMPNPKNGTISENPERLALSFAKGQINFKTETQVPIIHLTIGKLSMKDQELTENITTIIRAIGTSKIKNVTLKSTMSPGIKLDFSSLG